MILILIFAILNRLRLFFLCVCTVNFYFVYFTNVFLYNVRFYNLSRRKSNQHTNTNPPSDKPSHRAASTMKELTETVELAMGKLFNSSVK